MPSLLGTGGVHPFQGNPNMRLKIQENACGLARKLIANGLNPSEVLEFYRGDVLCLSGKAGDFARFRVSANGCGTPVFKYAVKEGSRLTDGVELEEGTLA